MFHLKPKDDVFFQLFSKGVKISSDSAKELRSLVNNLNNPHENIEKMSKLEHEGDVITHDLIEYTKKMFITPLDREDIFNITKGIDTITDTIEAAAHRFYMFNVSKATDECIEIIAKLVRATDELLIVIGELKTLNKSSILLQKIIDINTIENEADVLYRQAMKNLFENPDNILDVIKWKDIYKNLEDSVDSCEKLANEIRGVVMKYA